MLKRWLAGDAGQHSTLRQNTGVRLRAETLEAREVPATFTVNDPRDIALALIPLVPQQGGPPKPEVMTLRAALESSEASPGADIIDFHPDLLIPAGTTTTTEEGGGTTTTTTPAMRWLHLAAPLLKANAAEEVTIGGPGADSLGIEADATEVNKFRILSMTGGKVTVSGLAFQNGWAAGDGGAIQVIGGELSLPSCHLYNNKADGHGGAVYHSPVPGAGNPPDVGPLALVNCLFSNNHAVTALSWGGALHTASKNTPVTVQRSTFQYNTAGSHGGAISIVGGTPRDVLIESANGFSTNFLQNTAQRGGAISLTGDKVEVEIHGTTFNQNLGTVSAGAIYASGGSASYLTCTQSNFTGNWVQGLGGSAVGGAVVLSTQSATFDECTFSSNSAAYGGAIFLEGGALGPGQGPALTLINSSFQNNVATVLGPTICYTGTLNEDVWVFDLNSNLGPGDLVVYQ